jgi:hypothetical protein
MTVWFRSEHGNCGFRSSTSVRQRHILPPSPLRGPVAILGKMLVTGAHHGPTNAKKAPTACGARPTGNDRQPAEQAGDFQAYTQRAVQVNSSMWQFRQMLAEAYVQKGQWDGALRKSPYLCDHERPEIPAAILVVRDQP